jgi:hypothetical protein
MNDRLTIALPVLIAIILGAALTQTGLDFSLDDAWIHLAYAKSLKLFEGLSYNPYDFETGSSSPLWVIILSLVPWGSNAMVVSKMIGVFCFALSIFVLGVILKKWFPSLTVYSRLLLLLAGALAPLQIQGSVSGMSVSLASFLVLLALYYSSENDDLKSGVLAFLSVATRSELVVFWVVWSGVRWLKSRQTKQLTPGIAAVLSLSLWMLYCFYVSGYWFPNTKYVKALGQGLHSLMYFSHRYVWEEPILWSGVGLWFIGLGFWKSVNFDRIALGLAWLGCTLSILLSRQLDPSVLFFQSRYFAPLGLCLVIFVAFGLQHLKRQSILLSPILLALLWALPHRIDLIKDQESDIFQLHTSPSLLMSEKVPSKSIVLIEGAGAHRFHLPRDIYLVDVLGLNYKPIAHMTEMNELRCHLGQIHIDFAALPIHMVQDMMTIYALEELTRFEEDHYHQTEPPFTHTTIVFRSLGVRPEALEGCEVP